MDFLCEGDLGNSAPCRCITSSRRHGPGRFSWHWLSPESARPSASAHLMVQAGSHGIDWALKVQDPVHQPISWSRQVLMALTEPWKCKTRCISPSQASVCPGHRCQSQGGDWCQVAASRNSVVPGLHSSWKIQPVLVSRENVLYKEFTKFTLSLFLLR